MHHSLSCNRLSAFAFIVSGKVILQLGCELIHEFVLDLLRIWDALVTTLGLASSRLHAWHCHWLHDQALLSFLILKLLFELLDFLNLLLQQAFISLHSGLQLCDFLALG